PALQTLTVQSQLVANEQLFDGTVEAVHQATISAEVSGRIEKIFVDIDDYVSQGTEILRFRNRDQAASLKTAKARLSETQALLSNAAAEYKRIQRIFKDKLVSKSQLDKAEANHKAAKARVDSAQGNYSLAQEQMEKTLVRAPYSGIVTQRLVEVGETVTIGKPLMSGISLEKLRVNTWVPQKFVHRIRENQMAHIYPGNAISSPLVSSKITLFPVANESNNSFRTRIELPVGQHNLYPGTLVKVGFPLEQTQRLLIPESALVQRSELTAVYILTEDEKIRLRQVRTGRTTQQGVEILAGLRRGEVILLNPITAAEKLKSQSQE
ncbi:MAG: efflux RND transporter periplasmic adaptor subunit, partial [Gammaproteobacteria bacterium]